MTRNQIGNFIPGQDKLQSKWHFRDREKLIRKRKLGQKWRSERCRLPFPPSEKSRWDKQQLFSLSLSLSSLGVASGHKDRNRGRREGEGKDVSSNKETLRNPHPNPRKEKRKRRGRTDVSLADTTPRKWTSMRRRGGGGETPLGQIFGHNFHPICRSLERHSTTLETLIMVGLSDQVLTAISVWQIHLCILQKVCANIG